MNTMKYLLFAVVGAIAMITILSHIIKCDSHEITITEKLDDGVILTATGTVTFKPKNKHKLY